MNPWASRSIERAHEPGYLDALGEVYRVDPAESREVSPELMERIREAYEHREDAALLEYLLELDKFPFDGPYIRLLKRLPEAVRQNPATVSRIASQVRALDIRQLEGAIQAPKVANRRLGSRFSEWLRTLGYPLLDEDELLRSEDRIALLAGSDEAKKSFARRHLGYTKERGLDLLAKCGGHYVVGEAKFIGDYGGNQNNQLRNAMDLPQSQGSLENAAAVAVLDGVVWIRGNSKMHRAVASTEYDAMSALLLRDYLESFV